MITTKALSGEGIKVLKKNPKGVSIPSSRDKRAECSGNRKIRERSESKRQRGMGRRWGGGNNAPRSEGPPDFE